MFTHICVFFLITWTLDVLCHIARCDFLWCCYGLRRSRGSPKSSWKALYFCEINKMCLWCLLQHVLRSCLCRFSSHGRWHVDFTSDSWKTFHVKTYLPFCVWLIHTWSPCPRWQAGLPCREHEYLSNEVRNPRGRVGPRRHAVRAGEAGGAGGAGSLDTRRPDSCCQMGNHAETDIGTVLNPARSPNEAQNTLGTEASSL